MKEKPSLIVRLGGGFIAACVIFAAYSQLVLVPQAKAERARVEAVQRQAAEEGRRAQFERERAARERTPEYLEQQRNAQLRHEQQSLQVDVGSLCQVAIRRRLNDPGSADFDFVLTYHWQRNPNNRVLMFPTLRAKNAFGGLVRSSFACEVDVSDRQHLVITHLEQL